MTALVDPPIAPFTRIAFSNASRVRIRDSRTSSSHEIDDAASGDVGERVAPRVDRRQRGVEGQSEPQRLHHRAPWSTPCPSPCSGRRSATCRLRRRGTVRRSCAPARTSSLKRHTSVPEPMSWPQNLPFSIGPPETTSAGRSQLAAPITSAGVVLSQPQSSTTPSIGLPRIDSSTSMLTRLRNSIAVGRRFDSPSEVTGNSSGRPPASQTPRLTCSASVAQMRVAGRQLRPGVADADDRTAVEHVGREALIPHPAAVDESVFVLLTEPGGRAVGALSARSHDQRVSNSLVRASILHLAGPTLPRIRDPSSAATNSAGGFLYRQCCEECVNESASTTFLPASARESVSRQRADAAQRRDSLGRRRAAVDSQCRGAAIGRVVGSPAHDGAPRRVRRRGRHRRRIASRSRRTSRGRPEPTSTPRSRPRPSQTARPRVLASQRPFLEQEYQRYLARDSRRAGPRRKAFASAGSRRRRC